MQASLGLVIGAVTLLTLVTWARMEPRAVGLGCSLAALACGLTACRGTDEPAVAPEPAPVGCLVPCDLEVASTAHPERAPNTRLVANAAWLPTAETVLQPGSGAGQPRVGSKLGLVVDTRRRVTIAVSGADGTRTSLYRYANKRIVRDPAPLIDGARAIRIGPCPPSSSTGPRWGVYVGYVLAARPTCVTVRVFTAGRIERARFGLSRSC